MTDGIDREDLGHVLVPQVDDLDDEWMHYSDDFAREVRIYREACRQNIQNDRIRATHNHVVARLMPKSESIGGVIAHRTRYPDDGSIIARYGTVIAVGDYMRGDLEPGDEICFSQMFGRKFPGTYNPLKLDPETLDDEDADLDSYGWADWSDEIRIFKMDADHYEIIGKVEYDLVGETVRFCPPGQDPVDAEVLEESALMGGIARIRIGDDEETWVPHRYIES